MSTGTSGAHADVHIDREGPAWAAAHWLARAPDLEIPAAVREAARLALIDWFGCVVGGLDDHVVELLRRRLGSWAPAGPAVLLSGGSTTRPFAALLHATAAHAKDFDDTHIWTDAHFGGPTWAVITSRIGDEHRLTDEAALKAFVCGFETGTRLGGRRLGHAMVHRGFQATGLLGRIAGAAASAVLDGLDDRHAALALTIAACQTAGLSTTAGTMMKPFQGGKTAFDAVISADLAADGFTADPALLSTGGGALGQTRIGGLAKALVQDGYAEFAQPDFSAGWELLRNSTKPYPVLHSLCPVIDAARDAFAQIGQREVRKVRVYVGPSVPKIARYSRPATPHEARFSIGYCAALGLLGLPFSDDNFEPAVMHSERVQDLLNRTEVVPTEGRKMYNAAVEVQFSSGASITADVPLGRGHPGRELTQNEVRDKFMMLVEPKLGSAASELFELLSQFPKHRVLLRAFDLVRDRAIERASAS